METNAYFIRHAQSVANENSFVVCWRSLESPLTLQWYTQAHQLARYFIWRIKTRVANTYMVSSPSVRTISTINIVSSYMWWNHHPLVLTPDLLEVDQWVWTGQPIKTILTPEILSQIKNNPDFSPPNGESNREVVARMSRIVESIKWYPRWSTILFSCHGLSTRILLGSMLDSDKKISIPNTWIVHMSYSPENNLRILENIWETPHLNPSSL